MTLKLKVTSEWVSQWPNRCGNPVALHCVALRFAGFGGALAGESLCTHSKGPAATTFSGLIGGVALQVASWKVSRYRGVSQLHCRLLCYNGPLRWVCITLPRYKKGSSDLVLQT